MTEVNVRCAYPQCRVKTTAELDASRLEMYRDALRAGAERHLWDKYWAFLRFIEARCFLHEGLA